jgi:hypothetical protein
MNGVDQRIFQLHILDDDICLNKRGHNLTHDFLGKTGGTFKNE